MNYKISQRGHAALERNIKFVLRMWFAIIFFHPVNGNIAQFQNQMQTEKPGFRALGKLLYICLTQSYLLFLFIGFLPAAPASLQTTCFFPQNFHRININFPIPPELFESKKGLTQMLDIVSFANGALFSFKTKFINHNEKLRKSSFSVRVNVWRVFCFVAK